MSVEKACRMCRYVSIGAENCPVCGSSELTDNWAGFIIIINPETSQLAKYLDVKMAGKYALKVK